MQFKSLFTPAAPPNMGIYGCMLISNFVPTIAGINFEFTFHHSAFSFLLPIWVFMGIPPMSWCLSQ